ncbi:MAG: MBL fold metallo-hydrolase [Bacillota bacterium]|nr:MBL fold metallo-hydrolase [Bacillota bacterium]
MALKFCSLSSGSSGNCYLVGSDSTYILIDAGISAKKITDGLAELNLLPEDISGILITHEHSDHIKGIDVLSKKYSLPVFANEKTAAEMKSLCKQWDSMNINIFTSGRPFHIGDLKIKAFPVSHDAADTVGFSVINGKSKLCTATDTGCITDEILEEMYPADLIILEANHDEDILKMGRYPWFLKQRILSDCGHLSNSAAGEVIAKIIKTGSGPKRFLLAHLSRENNFPEMACQTILNILESYDIFPGDRFEMDLLRRDEISGVYLL